MERTAAAMQPIHEQSALVEPARPYRKWIDVSIHRAGIGECMPFDGDFTKLIVTIESQQWRKTKFSSAAAADIGFPETLAPYPTSTPVA